MGELIDLREYIDCEGFSTTVLLDVLWYMRNTPDVRRKLLVELHYRRMAGDDVPDPSDAFRRPPPPPA